MGDITIRLMTMDDRDRMEAFYGQMGTDARMFFDRNRANYKATMCYFDGKESQKKLHWVAVEDNEVVGYVFLWDVDTKIPWLGIAVAEKMRGRHFGQTLIETAEKWAKENDKGGLLLTTCMANVRAQTLYERCGFQRLGVEGCSMELLYLLRF